MMTPTQSDEGDEGDEGEESVSSQPARSSTSEPDIAPRPENDTRTTDGTDAA
jgi:hypothetical protein